LARRAVDDAGANPVEPGVALPARRDHCHDAPRRDLPIFVANTTPKGPLLCIVSHMTRFDDVPLRRQVRDGLPFALTSRARKHTARSRDLQR
ncbi:MAG: hypothetical protein ACRD0U_21565, partial [Acidimicrobiales bacterium]